MFREDQLSKNLQKEKKDIEAEIEALVEDLEAVTQLLKRLERPRITKHRVTVYNDIADIPVTPTNAIKKIFGDYPEEKFSPAQLRDKLVEMKRRGRMNSNAKNLLYVVHAIIKTLTDSGYLEKTKDKRPLYFRSPKDMKKRLKQQNLIE